MVLLLHVGSVMIGAHVVSKLVSVGKVGDAIGVYDGVPVLRKAGRSARHDEPDIEGVGGCVEGQRAVVVRSSVKHR